MRRTIIFTLILVTLLSLCSCRKEADLSDISFSSVNYNNVYYPSESICANGDTVIYRSDGFYDANLFAYHDGNKVKFLKDLDFVDEYICDFFALDDYVYFETENYSDNKYQIYKYSFSDKSLEKVFTIEDNDLWMGTSEYIAYLKYADIEEFGYDACDLYVYDIDSKTKTLIRKDVEYFGITDNNIRYIVPETYGSVTVLEYDVDTKETRELGKISFPYDYDYYTYNFTTNYTVIYNAMSSDKVTIQKVNSEQCDYQLPSKIQQLITCENFAYAVCYEYDEYDYTYVDHPDNGIYKIDLSTGAFEKIRNCNENTSIYVLSDDETYILQGDFNWISQYKTSVYCMNVSTKEEEKIFVY